jgi:hypothetical protein
MSDALQVWPVTSSVWRNNQVERKKISSKLNEHYINWAQDTNMGAEALAQEEETMWYNGTSRPCWHRPFSL